MGINISQIKNQNLKELASLVDNSFDGKTRGNGMIDDCELSVFIDKAKKSEMGAECAEMLGLSNTTQNNNVQNVKTKPSLSELETKIKKKKEEIKQICLKLEKPSYSQKGANIGAAVLGVSGGLLGLIGDDALIAMFATTVGLGAGVVIGGIIGGIVGKVVDLMSDKQETRTKEQVELEKALKKAEKELQILEKQYNEYQCDACLSAEHTCQQ